VIGDELCGTLRSLESVRPIVRHHHERLDGAGYPDGLAGNQIPLLAQIVRVVDVFDALTTDRPYRKALRAQAAYPMLLEEARAGWCSEPIVRRFIEVHRAGLAPARVETSAFESVPPRTARLDARPVPAAASR
jgi:putative two-component system response regulator